MNNEKEEERIAEEDVGGTLDITSLEGVYKRAEIVKVFCPACGEEFIGTKRHAGGFIAGHMAFHEFQNQKEAMVDSMGGQ